MRFAGGTLAALSAVLFIAGISVGAQTPAPPSTSPSPGTPPVTFAVEVAYVEVDAIVTDKAGEPVRDLTREDFVVLEDGKPQKIELFTRIDIPYERPEPSAPPAGAGAAGTRRVSTGSPGGPSGGAPYPSTAIRSTAQSGP